MDSAPTAGPRSSIDCNRRQRDIRRGRRGGTGLRKPVIRPRRDDPDGLPAAVTGPARSSTALRLCAGLPAQRRPAAHVADGRRRHPALGAAENLERRPRDGPAPVRTGHHRVRRAGRGPGRRSAAIFGAGDVRGAVPRPAGRRRASAERATAASVSSSIGLPAQPHSTVRSLSSNVQQTPWSTPYTRPSTPCQDVAALAVGVVDEHVENRHPHAAGGRRRGSG